MSGPDGAAAIIERFGLVPLAAEGGFVRRYWPGPSDEAADGSAILFLVTDGPDGSSRFHRLARDEVWHRYLGDPAELVLLEPGGASRHVLLGDDLGAGHVPVCVVPAGTWMACRTTGAWSLLGTTMAPAFTPDCFEEAARDDLVAGWPEEVAAIDALTPGGPRGAPAAG